MAKDTMAERMVRVESKLEALSASNEATNAKIDKIDLKLDKVIDDFPKTYATIESVHSLKEHFDTVNNKQDTKLRDLTNQVVKLAKDLALIGGIIYFWLQSNGGLP